MLLKLSSSRKASNWARLRAVESHWGNKLLGVGSGPERRLQFGESVVVKAKICGHEFFFQDGGPGEEHHGGPLRLAVGDQQDLALALKERSRDVAVYVLREGDRAVVEGDVEGSPLERHFADVIDPRFVEAHIL